jgi:hypothetical protein
MGMSKLVSSATALALPKGGVFLPKLPRGVAQEDGPATIANIFSSRVVSFWDLLEVSL